MGGETSSTEGPSGGGECKPLRLPVGRILIYVGNSGALERASADGAASLSTGPAGETRRRNHLAHGSFHLLQGGEKSSMFLELRNKSITKKFTICLRA